MSGRGVAAAGSAEPQLGKAGEKQLAKLGLGVPGNARLICRASHYPTIQ